MNNSDPELQRESAAADYDSSRGSAADTVNAVFRTKVNPRGQCAIAIPDSLRNEGHRVPVGITLMLLNGEPLIDHRWSQRLRFQPDWIPRFRRLTVVVRDPRTGKVERPLAGIHYPKPLGELRAWFWTDADCLDYLEWLRWPHGFVCPPCGHPEG